MYHDKATHVSSSPRNSPYKWVTSRTKDSDFSDQGSDHSLTKMWTSENHTAYPARLTCLNSTRLNRLRNLQFSKNCKLNRHYRCSLFSSIPLSKSLLTPLPPPPKLPNLCDLPIPQKSSLPNKQKMESLVDVDNNQDAAEESSNSPVLRPIEMLTLPAGLFAKCNGLINKSENHSSYLTDEELPKLIASLLDFNNELNLLHEKRNHLKEELQRMISLEVAEIRRLHAYLPPLLQEMIRIEGDKVTVLDYSSLPFIGWTSFGIPPGYSASIATVNTANNEQTGSAYVATTTASSAAVINEDSNLEVDESVRLPPPPSPPQSPANDEGFVSPNRRSAFLSRFLIKQLKRQIERHDI